jgi:O-antigen/teichoic acid export membrane protein
MGILNKLQLLMKSEGLLGRCVRGGAFLTLGGVLENLSRFIRNMILARLLVPEAFGLMATVMAAVAALEAFAEVGLRQSVIQNRRGAEESFLNITWWISSLRGIGLYAIAFLATPIICQFFNKPDAILELRVGFLVILLNGLISPRIHVLEKEMRFGNWVLLIQGAAFSGILVAIISAFFLRNVWALILGYLTGASLRTMLSFVCYPFKPSLKFDRESFREIMQFSRGMFGLPILMMLFAQTDVFVIGKVVSLELLGMYVLARAIAEMPVTVISKIVNPVILPAFSSMQGDRDKLRAVLLAVTRAASIFGMSLIASLILFSKPLLSFAYGPQYGRVAIPFSILCLYSFILMCAQVIMEMYLSIGKPDIHRIASLVRAAIFLLIIYPLTKNLGLIGASLSTLIGVCVSFSIQLIYVRKMLGIEILEYLKTWTQGIKLSVVVVMIPGLLFKIFFDKLGTASVGVGVLLGLIAWALGFKNLGLLRNIPIAKADDVSPS